MVHALHHLCLSPGKWLLEGGRGMGSFPLTQIGGEMRLDVCHVGFYLVLVSVGMCLHCTQLNGGLTLVGVLCFSFSCAQLREGVLIKIDESQVCFLAHGPRLWLFGVIREWVQTLDWQWAHFGLFLPRKLDCSKGFVVGCQTSSRLCKEPLAPPCFFDTLPSTYLCLSSER